MSNKAVRATPRLDGLYTVEQARIVGARMACARHGHMLTSGTLMQFGEPVWACSRCDVEVSLSYPEVVPKLLQEPDGTLRIPGSA